MASGKLSLLSSQARVQSPWIKVQIGEYTFGVFDRKTKSAAKNNENFYSSYNIQYPSYVNSLSIVKINGQVNQYTLQLSYPVKIGDDPNFFEKVFSSVSNTRKIVFSYGDASMPSYVYKDEEAIITKVTQSFNISSSVISYTVEATSSSVVGKTGAFTFVNTGKKRPSEEIWRVFRSPEYGLQKLFPGMTPKNFWSLVEGGDKEVELTTKTNISPLDYIIYLVSCMVPDSSTTNNRSSEIYLLTIHDESVYDKLYSDTASAGGPYFKISKASTITQQSDAYVIDIGYNTSTIVTNFSIEKNENFSLYYDYNAELYPEQYVRRLNNKGQWEDVYAPMFTSGNDKYKTRPEDISWYTKVTKYPISASVTIQGLLRPANLMQYVRLNVIFPGGNKHISSGLYIITKQVDVIDSNGYRTTLSLAKIAGDTN